MRLLTKDSSKSVTESAQTGGSDSPVVLLRNVVKKFDTIHASSSPPVHMLHLLVAENGKPEGKDFEPWRPYRAVTRQ